MFDGEIRKHSHTHTHATTLKSDLSQLKLNSGSLRWNDSSETNIWVRLKETDVVRHEMMSTRSHAAEFVE